MKVAVSGANGYLGSHVVEKLLKYGHEVVAIDVKFDNISADVERVNENIFSSDESIFHKLGEPDCLIHLAWRDGFNHASLNHMGDLSNHYKFLINSIN